VHPYRHAPVDIIEERVVIKQCDNPVFEKTKDGFILHYTYKFNVEQVRVPMENLEINVNLKPQLSHYMLSWYLSMIFLSFVLGAAMDLIAIFNQ
jgi:hypothetical protein